jgi:hypothetical protein
MNVTICSGLPYKMLHVHSFLFSTLCSVTLGTGVVRTADMLGNEVAGTDCAECYVIAGLWDVT